MLNNQNNKKFLKSIFIVISIKKDIYILKQKNHNKKFKSEHIVKVLFLRH